MRGLVKLFFVLVLAVILVILVAGITKLLWSALGMGAWTGLGEIPWGPALFLAIWPISIRSFKS